MNSNAVRIRLVVMKLVASCYLDVELRSQRTSPLSTVVSGRCERSIRTASSIALSRTLVDITLVLCALLYSLMGGLLS